MGITMLWHFFLADAGWGVGYAIGGSALVNFTSIYFLALALNVFFFCRYATVYLGVEKRIGRIVGFVSFAFLILELLLIGFNYTIPVFFHAGGSGEYYPGGMVRNLFYFLIFFVIALTVALAFLSNYRNRHHKEKHGLDAILAWSGCILACGATCQYFFPVSPSFSIGLILAMLIIRMFFHEEELARQVKLLSDSNLANQAKTTFLQNMSHEIRTPLNTILGFSQLLSVPGMTCTDEEKEEYGSYILNSYELLDLLISDILDVADFGNNNYRIELAPMPVNKVCRNALKNVEMRCPGNVVLKFETNLSDDFSIVSDKRRIQQVLVNYLTNACKHTLEGSITLKCSHMSGDHVKFTVTDTGCGVPPEKADVIFGRFTKLERNTQGSGLGLNICRVIASKLGGSVYLDTRYTNGARFVFEL